MHEIYCKIKFIPLFFIFISCADLIIPELKVVKTEIEKEKITVEFSKDINSNLTIESFSFLKDNEEQEGNFSVEKRFLYFEPFYPVEDGYNYTVKISTKAEDIYGSSLMEPYSYFYSAKNENTNPEITSIEPKNQEVTSAPVSFITINFSKPIIPVSFQDSFSIKPSASYKLEWAEDAKSVKVIFDKPLNLSERYTISISKSLSDTDNNFLVNSFTSIFTNGNDFTSPEFSVYSKTDLSSLELKPSDEIEVNEGLLCDSYLSIEFNEEVDLDKISSLLSIKPSLSYSIIPDSSTKKSVKLSFTSQPPYGDTKYELAVKKGITDLAQNKTLEDKIYYFKFNNSKNQNIKFVKGIFNLKSSWFDVTEDNTNTNIIFRSEDFQPGDDIETPFYLFFQISPDAKCVDIISAMANITSSTTNSCVSITYKTMKEQSVADLTSIIPSANLSDVNTLISEGKNIYCIKIGVIIDNGETNGQVRFTINSELEDDLKNKIDKKIVLSYNKS